MENVKLFEEITKKMCEVYKAKNADYGNSFEESMNKFGLTAGIVRLYDKMNRVSTLSTKERQIKEESIKDTLLDMANYAIMTLMWLEKNNK